MSPSVTIDYTNHRGERAKRRVLPLSWRFGTTKWHPVEQWLMTAHDLDTDVEREFTVAEIHSWTPGT